VKKEIARSNGIEIKPYEARGVNGEQRGKLRKRKALATEE
jgi:hypothetical protein